MNYEDLKEVLRDLKKMIRCSKCRKRFLDRNIVVIATIPTDGIFQLDCDFCKHSMIVNISLKAETTIRDKASLKTKGRIVTTNDILDMHNFLDKFNGDFQELFNKQL